MQFIRNFQLKYDCKHTKSIYLCTSYHNHLLVNVLYGLMKIIFLPWIVGTSCVLPGRTSWRLCTILLTYHCFWKKFRKSGLGFRIRTQRQHFFFWNLKTTFIQIITYRYNFYNVLFLITL